nr:hypothetical protein [Tanacetum cinerariifolium]
MRHLVVILFLYLSPTFPSDPSIMSLDNLDNYAMPGGVPVDPSLEATVLPKFDTHLYRSCLDEKHVKCLVRCYGIPEDLHPRVAPAVMTMDRLPDNAIRLYVHHFQ